MFSNFVYTFYARLEACALRINTDTVYPLSEEENSIVP